MSWQGYIQLAVAFVVVGGASWWLGDAGTLHALLVGAAAAVLYYMPRPK